MIDNNDGGNERGNVSGLLYDSMICNEKNNSVLFPSLYIPPQHSLYYINIVEDVYHGQTAVRRGCAGVEFGGGSHFVIWLLPLGTSSQYLPSTI